MPPKDATDRLNFLREHQTHIWRLKSERLDACLGGQDPFAKQTRLDRAIPLAPNPVDRFLIFRNAALNPSQTYKVYIL